MIETAIYNGLTILMIPIGNSKNIRNTAKYIWNSPVISTTFNSAINNFFVTPKNFLHGSQTGIMPLHRLRPNIIPL